MKTYAVNCSDISANECNVNVGLSCQGQTGSKTCK